MNLISSSRIQKDAIKLCKFHNLPQSFAFSTTSDFVYRSQKHALSSNDCGAILQSLTNSKSLKMGQTLHGYVVSSGIIQDNTYLCTKIAVFYASCGCMNAARIIFDQIVDKSCFLWNFMIRGYASNGFSMQAISLYETMMRVGVLSDHFTYPFVIKACGDLSHVYLGRIVHAQTVINGFHFNIYVANCLLAMYAKFGDMENARKVFDGMPNRDLTSCNTIISGYAKNGNPEAARIFREMLGAGPVMDSTIDSMKLESGSWQGGDGNGGVGHPELGLNVVRNNKDCDYDETNLYIARLPHTLGKLGLMSLFSAFGEIVIANVVKERGTNMGTGYGFVKYANVNQANAAVVGMNGRLIDGRRITVRIAGKPPQLAPPQPQANPPASYLPLPPGSSYYPPSVQTHIMQSRCGVYGGSPVSMAHTHPSYIPSSYAYSPYCGAPPPAVQPQVLAIFPRASNLPRRPPVGRLLRELMRNKGSSWQK